MLSHLLPYFDSLFMSIIFLHLRFVFGRYRRNTHVTELTCLGPHQHVCLGLPPSGCFSRWWDDFAHWINQYVPPTEPEGNHHSPLPGTYSNLLPSVCSKQGTDQSDFFPVFPAAPGHIPWSRAGTRINWHPPIFSYLNPHPCAFDFKISALII